MQIGTHQSGRGPGRRFHGTVCLRRRAQFVIRPVGAKKARLWTGLLQKLGQKVRVAVVPHRHLLQSRCALHARRTRKLTTLFLETRASPSWEKLYGRRVDVRRGLRYFGVNDCVLCDGRGRRPIWTQKLLVIFHAGSGKPGKRFEKITKKYKSNELHKKFLSKNKIPQLLERLPLIHLTAALSYDSNTAPSAHTHVT